MGGSAWACPGAKRKTEKENKDKAAKAKAKASKAVKAPETKGEDPDEYPDAEQQWDDDEWWNDWDEHAEGEGEWWDLDDVPPYEGCNSGFPGEGVGS